MATLDYVAAAEILEGAFQRVAASYSQGQRHQLSIHEGALTSVFDSKTSAFREALLGCVLAKLTNPSINPRTAYIDFGADAFSGRGLDERVVNPFLRANQIPCSKSPYLSVLRRSVRFDSSMRRGVKDKAAFDAFDNLLSAIGTDAEPLLERILEKFLELRDKSAVDVARVPRASLPQLKELIDALLRIPSGGRFPVLITVATLRAVTATWGLGWDVRFQGINVADNASGAGGDISVVRSNELLFALEVTERPMEATRIQATYQTKIAPLSIRDYLFVVDIKKVAPEASGQALKYFTQGFDVNFVDLKDWTTSTLATIGGVGRSNFTAELVRLISERNFPSSLKIDWNNAVFRLTS